MALSSPQTSLGCIVWLLNVHRGLNHTNSNASNVGFKPGRTSPGAATGP